MIRSVALSIETVIATAGEVPPLLEAVKLGEYTPGVVGVPLNTPVAVLRVTPGGRDPEARA